MVLRQQCCCWKCLCLRRPANKLCNSVARTATKTTSRDTYARAGLTVRALLLLLCATAHFAHSKGKHCRFHHQHRVFLNQKDTSSLAFVRGTRVLGGSPLSPCPHAHGRGHTSLFEQRVFCTFMIAPYPGPRSQCCDVGCGCCQRWYGVKCVWQVCVAPRLLSPKHLATG